MKRHNRIEKAIIMSLLLSSSIYGVASAETINDSIKESIEQDVISATVNNADVVRIDNKDVNVSSTSGDNTLTLKNENGISRGELAVVNIVDGKLVGEDNIIFNKGNANIIASSDNILNSTYFGLRTGKYSSGNINLEANNNIITTIKDGIKAQGSGDITVNSRNGNTIITAGENAIYNHGSGTINIYSKSDTDISTLEDKHDYDVILTGEENGIKTDSTGDTNIIADHDNIIAGTNNGILSDGTGKINVTAGNNNYIGQYTDAEGNIHTSENGINVSEGTVTVTSGNENYIYGIDNGIIATGNNNIVNLSGKENNIIVKNIEGNATGINIKDRATINLNKDDGLDNQSVNIDVVSKNGNAIGIDVENNSTLKMDKPIGDLIINAEGTTSATGIYVRQNDIPININSNGNIVINAKSDDLSGSSGIVFSKSNGKIKANDNIIINNVTNIEDINKSEFGITINNDSELILDSNLNIINGRKAIDVGKVAPVPGGSPNDDSKLDIVATSENGGNYITATENGISVVNRKDSESMSTVNLDGKNNIINVYANTNAGIVSGISSADGAVINIGKKEDVIHSERTEINVVNDINSKASYIYAVQANREGNINIDSDTIIATISGSLENQTVKGISNDKSNVVFNSDNTYIAVEGKNSYGIYTLNGGNSTLTANNSNIIEAERTGIYVSGIDSKVNLIAKNGSNIVSAVSDGSGIYTFNGLVKLEAKNGYNKVSSDKVVGLKASGSSGNINLTAKGNIVNATTGIWSISESKIKLDAIEEGNVINAKGYGIYTESESTVNLEAKNGINSISSDNNNAIYTATNGVVSLDAKSNLAQAGDVSTGYGTGTVIQAMADSKINLTATDTNQLLGTVYAEGTEANITLEAKNNVIRSTAHGKNEGHESLVSALYVHDNGNVDITAKDGGYNYIASSYDSIESENGAERTIWAQQGGKINIEGKTFILAENSDKNTGIIGGDGHEQEGNSIGIAIAAGTGEGLDDYKNQDGSLIDIPDKERSTVNLDYSGDINGLNSYIKGDIVSGYGGLINIQRKDSNVTGGIDIQGNALAGNGGKLNIDLGNGGTWVGRADDYGDAGYGASAQDHQNFYNPAFSNEIIEGGTVNLTMGDNSTWYVNGQSWITSINTENAQNATIDLVEANTDRNNSAHALTVYNLNGNANINMSLDGNRDVSDMLYIKEAHGEYNIALADAVTTEDIYAGGLDGLRFATVGTGSDVKFRAGAYDKGFFNVEYEVGSDKYDGNEENHIYNGDEFDGEHGKVGDDGVDKFFDNNEEGSETQTVATDEVVEDNLDHVDETTNYKLTGRIGEEISDAGKTIINMSRANYDQAVYMDSLNKRLGEARYLDGDEGVWVRMRHDKIDKDNGYEINNNMYELGYDKKYDSKDNSGYHRRGVAIDYMDGDTSYDGIGSGETNRKGLWFYDTWFGNKGHYTDYVAKWGHLENSFDLYTKSAGEKVNGEYNNDVYSLSAEWGYKDELKNGWYFEPQTQLQYARVTGADYETSQGTQVSLDGIDSLIARAGFRLGKDFGKEQKSTVYVKADVLHEFLGDQDIAVRDKTTDGNILTTGYDNDGTWYSVGLGFSTMLSDNSYAFLDVEKLFGNDHDNSYQINGGFNWTF